MMLPHFSQPQLYPKAKFHAANFEKQEDQNHWEQFVMACKGEAKTTADFAYAGPLTETILTGCIASRFPNTTLKWNPPGLSFDLQEANQFVGRHYRKDWIVEGLS